MNSRTVFFASPATLLAQWHARALGEEGLTVSLAADAESALTALRAQLPEALVLDPLQPAMPAAELVRLIRATPALQALPLILLPSAHTALAREAQRAGATWQLERGKNPGADLLDALQTCLRLPRTAALRRRELPLPPPLEWSAALRAKEREHLGEIRDGVHLLARNKADRQAAHQILMRCHALTESLGLGGPGTAFTFAAATELLAATLCEMPERVNASTLQTMSEAADFLARLLGVSAPAELPSAAEAHVLVVDDQSDARRVIADALALVGLRARTAGTPEEALAAVSAGAFDLIFLDIGMPGMSGLQLCERLRTLPRGKDVPVVFITGLDTFANRAQSSLLGGNGMIGKPFNVAELGVKALRWILQSRLKG